MKFKRNFFSLSKFEKNISIVFRKKFSILNRSKNLHSLSFNKAPQLIVKQYFSFSESVDEKIKSTEILKRKTDYSLKSKGNKQENNLNEKSESNLIFENKNLTNVQQIKTIDSEEGTKRLVVENLAFRNLKIPSVTIVRTREDAIKVVDILKNKLKNRFHAWDTETIGIDPKENSPVTHGEIICFSCFAGPDVDFGNGPRLFIDNYADSQGVIEEFKDYFEDSTYLKVWHNYGFDRHIFHNHGIDVKGFGGDTLHMARMFDTSKLPNEFSLQKLSEIYHDELIKMRMHYLNYFKKFYSNNSKILEMMDIYEKFNNGALKKIDMKTLFRYKKTLANGEEGKLFIMPDIEELHTNPKFVKDWITYSVLDAEVTYYLRDMLQQQLQSLHTQTFTHKNPIEGKYQNNYELYINYWRPFGELMTDMERVGIKIDVGYLKNIQIQAENDIKNHEKKFIEWVQSEQPEAREFNPGSTAQLQQLLFAPCKRRLSKEKASKLRFKKISDEEEVGNGVNEDDEDISKILNNFNGVPKNNNENSKEVEVLPAQRSFKVLNIYVRSKQIIYEQVFDF
jgi:DNA polymerase-1